MNAIVTHDNLPNSDKRNLVGNGEELLQSQTNKVLRSV